MSAYQYKIICVGCGRVEKHSQSDTYMAPSRCPDCRHARPWIAEKGRYELKLKWGFWPVREWVKHEESQ